MTERLNGAGTTLLEHSQVEEEGETLRVSSEVPKILAHRAFVLDAFEADPRPEQPSLLSQARRRAEYAALETGKRFNSQI
jgi:hypothetical protein